MTREPLVLIHGAGGTPQKWAPVVPLLTGTFDVHVPALVGTAAAGPSLRDRSASTPSWMRWSSTWTPPGAPRER